MNNELVILSNFNEINFNKWKEFVFNHSNGNVFQTPEFYLSCLEYKLWEPSVVILEENKDIVGVIVGITQREKSGIIGNFTARSVVWGAPLVNNDNTEYADILLRESTRIQSKKAIYIQYRNLWEMKKEMKNVFLNNGYSIERHLNIRIDLTLGLDNLWKGVKRNRKDGILKSKKHNFTFRVSNQITDIDIFFELLTQTYASAKLPYPQKKFFTSLLHNMDADNAKLFFLDYNSIPVVSLFAFLYNGNIYAFYIGTTKQNDVLNLRPVDLFYWKMLEWGVNNGFKYFDWMGAGKPDEFSGTRKFKEQYGGTYSEPGRYLKINKKLKYKIGVLGLEIYKKLK